MSLKQKAFTSLIWSLINNFGSQFFSLVIFLVLARLLTPATFGLIALANVFIAFMRIFLDQGFCKALIQREDVDSSHWDTAFWTQLGCGILLTITTFFSANLIASFFRQPQLTSVLQYLSLIFIIRSLGKVHDAILSREFAFKIIALRSLLATVIGGVVGIIMAYLDFGVWSLVCFNLTSATVSLIFLWSAIEWRPKWRFSPSHFQDLFSFGIYIFAFKFVKFFNKRSDNLLIGYFLGEVALGYYAIAYRILELMTRLLVDTIDKVALPTFSRLQNEPKRFTQLFYQATQFTSLFAFPVYMGIAIFAPELIISLFGKQWLESIPIMQILVFEGIVLCASRFHLSVFISTGKPAWNVKVTLVNTIVNLIACLIAVQYGIVAVAIAYTCTSFLVFPVSQWAVSKLIKINLWTYLNQFTTPVVSTILMAVALLAVKKYWLPLDYPRLSIVMGTLIGMLVYALSIIIFDRQLLIQAWELVKSGRKKKTKSSN